MSCQQWDTDFTDWTRINTDIFVVLKESKIHEIRVQSV